MAAVLCLFIVTLPQTASAQNFKDWLAQTKREAISKGISEKTVNAALDDAEFLSRVIQLDRKQPESRLTFPQYKKNTVSSARVEKGRELLRLHRNELERASRNTCGIAPEYILSLWGMETNFGSNTGGFEVISALATLAYDGRRSKFFKDELFRALEILDEGHIGLHSMTGSWAGAMGQNQFMPSSFQRFAVDGNGDGKRDIWNSLPDVFASTANYLCKSGWQADERWGREVKLRQQLPKSLTGLEIKRPLSQWAGMGVTLPDGSPLPHDSTMLASLVIPDGSANGYLVYNNYRTIMKWNRSVYFATSVGLLADAIAGYD